MAFEAYLVEARRAIDRVAEQGAAIRAAAAVVAETVAAGGVLHAFGCGHSHLLAEEIFYRAGGLAAVNPILDRRLLFLEGALASTRAEQELGYARRVLARETLGSDDAAVVISNSGRNVTPVEMALELRERGLPVIAVTSVTHANAVQARHASGRKLHEIADVVLDTGTPVGDASVELPGTGVRMGPLSTIAGAAMLHAVMIEAAMLVLARGCDPPVLPSANAAGTSERDLVRLLGRYAGRIRYLDVASEPG